MSMDSGGPTRGPHLALAAEASQADNGDRRPPTSAQRTPPRPLLRALTGETGGPGGPLSGRDQKAAAYKLLREAPEAVRDIWNDSFEPKKLRRRCGGVYIHLNK